MKAIHGLTALAVLFGSAAWAGPEIVSGPGADPECFAPWSADTKYFQWEKKEGPYRIALVNGFVGNTWRIQMIKMAKTFAEDPSIKDKIKEFKVVSTGTDAPAQLGAIEDFINQGFDAIITIAVSPDGFDRVIRLADKNDVVLVPFDNVLDTDTVMQVNEDQIADGPQLRRSSSSSSSRSRARPAARSSRSAACPATRSTATARSASTRSSTRPAATWDIVQVVGMWDDGTAQKVTADAIAVQGPFDGFIVQGGTTGVVQAMMDAGHPFVPVAGETENGFRKLVAKHSGEGLKAISIGQSPGLVAISMKAAVSALEGNPMPQLISVPLPSADRHRARRTG